MTSKHMGRKQLQFLNKHHKYRCRRWCQHKVLMSERVLLPLVVTLSIYLYKQEKLLLLLLLYDMPQSSLAINSRQSPNNTSIHRQTNKINILYSVIPVLYFFLILTTCVLKLSNANSKFSQLAHSYLQLSHYRHWYSSPKERIFIEACHKPNRSYSLVNLVKESAIGVLVRR